MDFVARQVSAQQSKIVMTFVLKIHSLVNVILSLDFHTFSGFSVFICTSIGAYNTSKVGKGRKVFSGSLLPLNNLIDAGVHPHELCFILAYQEAKFNRWFFLMDKLNLHLIGGMWQQGNMIRLKKHHLKQFIRLFIRLSGFMQYLLTYMVPCAKTFEQSLIYRTSVRFLLTFHTQ